MRLVRLLLYALAALVGLYVLAVVLDAIPMVGGLIDDTMAVKFDRPDPSIGAGTAMVLTPRRSKVSTTSPKARRSCRGSC